MCAILILDLGSGADRGFEGGEQLLITDSKVLRLKCAHGDLFIGRYQDIAHAVLPVTKGTRLAIIAYTNMRIHNFCKLHRLMTAAASTTTAAAGASSVGAPSAASPGGGGSGSSKDPELERLQAQKQRRKRRLDATEANIANRERELEERQRKRQRKRQRRLQLMAEIQELASDDDGSDNDDDGSDNAL